MSARSTSAWSNGAEKPSLVFVGGGPRTVSLMERIAANADLIPAGGLDVHIVDPFPVGGGRIWRRNQSPLLWMNSVAKDVTVFLDESVVCAGPIVPGPPLDQWVAGVGRQVLIDNGLRAAADAFKAHDFASREIQSLYLSWTFESVLSSLPASVTVTRHLQRAVSVRETLLTGGSPDGASAGTSSARQAVRLADGTALTADLVVLAQGYLDRHPTRAEKELSAAASEHDLVYIPPGYTADVDLSGLRPGADVLVRGFGLAFIDVMVLVFEGRGGRFVEGHEGLTYLPGGAEPVLHVGSRRGVPYHAKLGYSLGSAAPVPPVYFTPAALESFGPDHPADFRTQLWPLIVKELTAVHYRRLFEFHAERTRVGWEEFSAVLDRTDPTAVTDQDFADYVASAVPDPADRFDLAAIDRPLAGREFPDHGALADALVGEISADLARRADPAYSPDHAVFNGLLTVYGVLAGAVVGGRVSAQDRVQRVEGAFHGLFSFLASGPPPRRLHELLALHRAGFIDFVGPDMQVRVENGRFVGSSPAVAGTVEADALIDARLPRPDVRAASDPVIARLLADGEVAAEDLVAEDGRSLGGGQLLADASCRAVRADRTVHPTRFLLGPSVSGSAGSAGFARPGFNGAGFRQNDQVARELLRLAAVRGMVATAPDPDTSSPLKESESSHAR
ncbi:putative NAD(P)/FAD-binding protein YdhS [Nakamurella sp. UYEF19]|uniref:FAD/NAD(P)-binding protein n=1 Tax=Nakamurella sp. UYEF19 TaxID=1756392 RepID=UPI003395D69B